jgi:hypothetical protein
MFVIGDPSCCGSIVHGDALTLTAGGRLSRLASHAAENLLLLPAFRVDDGGHQAGVDVAVVSAPS